MEWHHERCSRYRTGRAYSMVRVCMYLCCGVVAWRGSPIPEYLNKRSLRPSDSTNYFFWRVSLIERIIGIILGDVPRLSRGYQSLEESFGAAEAVPMIAPNLILLVLLELGGVLGKVMPFGLLGKSNPEMVSSSGRFKFSFPFRKIRWKGLQKYFNLMSESSRKNFIIFNTPPLLGIIILSQNW